ncbi:MAG: cupin domain-containing protein [Paracoccaceae bacterium]
MILRKGSVPAEHRGPRDRPGRIETIRLSDAGGLTQFGAYEEILYPGTASSNRHWHSAEDEFLYLLDGTATVIDDDGEHGLYPGDAAVWRAGVPNAHHVLNRTDKPLRYLIVGSRIANDICSYPDSGARQINTATEWELQDRTGARARGGALPPELLSLPPDWTNASGATAGAPRIVRATEARRDSATPEMAAALGEFEALLYSDTGGLAQFGAFAETLMPEAKSSYRHWHAAEDEFLYALEGSPTVIDDAGPHILAPGDAAAWKAGVADAHHVVNFSPLPCAYLVIGTRLPSDIVRYPDDDRLYVRENGIVRRTRRDGSPL